MGVAVILDMWPTFPEQTFTPKFHMKFALIRPSGFEVKMLENIDGRRMDDDCLAILLAHQRTLKLMWGNIPLIYLCLYRKNLLHSIHSSFDNKLSSYRKNSKYWDTQTSYRSCP